MGNNNQENLVVDSIQLVQYSPRQLDSHLHTISKPYLTKLTRTNKPKHLVESNCPNQHNFSVIILMMRNKVPLLDQFH